jgi:hypothetical protein
MQSLVALALALSVFAILVSPFAASELTTLRGPQNTRPHVVAVPLALYAPLATWFVSVAPAWQPEAQLVVPGSEVVALTCARLC